MIPSEGQNTPGEAIRALAEAYRERSTPELLEILESDLPDEAFSAAFSELYRRLDDKYRAEVEKARCQDSSSST